MPLVNCLRMGYNNIWFPAERDADRKNLFFLGTARTLGKGFPGTRSVEKAVEAAILLRFWKTQGAARKWPRQGKKQGAI